MPKKPPVGSPPPRTKNALVGQPLPTNAVSEGPVMGLPVGDVSAKGPVEDRPARVKSESVPTRNPIKRRSALKPIPKQTEPLNEGRGLRKDLPSSPHKPPEQRAVRRENPVSPRPEPEQRAKRELPTSPHKPPELRSGRRTRPKLVRK